MNIRFLRHIALLTLSVLAVGCSHDGGDVPGGGEVLPPENGTPITLGGSLQDEQSVTRSESPFSSVATTFVVHGYKNMSVAGGSYGDLQQVFPGYTVNWAYNSAATTTTNSSGWEYVSQQPYGGEEQTIKYWDWGAAAYRFFGATNWGGSPPVEPASYEANKSYGAVSGSAYEMTMAIDLTSLRSIEELPYYSYLWFSNGNTAEGCQPFGQAVRLVFLKPCTRVRFMYTYVFERESILLESQEFKPTADYSVVAPAEPAGIARKGIFTVSYPLTGTATKESYTMDPYADGKLTALLEDYDPVDRAKEYLDSSYGWYYVFPCTSQGSYTLSVTINREEKRCTVPAEYMQWLPGYSYTYVFKINDEGGVEIALVQSAVTDWTVMEGEHTVYNW